MIRFVACWALFLAVVGITVLTFTHQLQVMNIHGNSMNPQISKGDLALSLPRREYQIGDVVAYKAEWSRGHGQTVLHRITQIAPNGYSLKGDNNHTKDPLLVQQDQIQGKLVVVLPHLGDVLGWVQHWLWAGCILAIALILAVPQLPSARLQDDDMISDEQGWDEYTYDEQAYQEWEDRENEFAASRFPQHADAA